MTDRDEFAKAALIGLLAHRQTQTDPMPTWLVNTTAQDAYRLADAMLSRRELKQPKETAHE